ncbi:DnaJ domain-containing protein [Kovacikia minuta CCNUW1]|uniref:J domain-containing protein n=1 Tax=Kovacikia minuta TaxID=2931930 RepID=UPI001CCC5772|nr:J domain-containing protein [Kovacikia minuta]UBF25447.1 DnaJ domain-containing protein [Kovacikia minuta CCNUW1]
MSQSSLPSDWLNQFSDPYALLGVSVAADDRRILSRYRTVAKLLHPDSQALADEAAKQLAGQLFARLVNPAYQKLKQEKGRAESVALLRIKVRRLNREASLSPKSALANQLMQHPVAEVDVFYEQAIAHLAESQYKPLDQFETITRELSELNLVYLQLKMGEMFVREKRTGVVSAAEAKPLQFTPVSTTSPIATENYAQRHYRRAQEYMKKANWSQAVQELRDAIKIEADKSEYHAMLGIAYLHQNLKGMATVHFRQALKLNPQDPLATKYAAKLGIQTNAATNAQPNGKAANAQQNPKVAKGGGLFGLFRSRK